MVEIIIAISIITGFGLIILNVAQKSVMVSGRTIHSIQAAFLLEEGVESVKIFRDNNTWNNFTSFFNTSSTYCLPGVVANWNAALSTSSPCDKIGIFTRVVNFSAVNRDASSGDIVSSGGTLDSETKLITVTVSWQEGSEVVTKVVKFYINNIFS